MITANSWDFCCQTFYIIKKVISYMCRIMIGFNWSSRDECMARFGADNFNARGCLYNRGPGMRHRFMLVQNCLMKRI